MFRLAAVCLKVMSDAVAQIKKHIMYHFQYCLGHLTLDPPGLAACLRLSL